MSDVNKDYLNPLPVIVVTPTLLAAMLAKEVADASAVNTAYTTAVGEQFRYTFSRTMGTTHMQPLLNV